MLTPEEEAEMRKINQSLCALIRFFEDRGATFILARSLQKKHDQAVMENVLATKATREQYLASAAQWTRHMLNHCDGAEGFKTILKSFWCIHVNGVTF